MSVRRNCCLKSKLLALFLFQFLIFFPLLQRGESQSSAMFEEKSADLGKITPVYSIAEDPLYFIQLASLVKDKPVWNIRAVSYGKVKGRNKRSKNSRICNIRPFAYGKLERDIWLELTHLKRKKYLIPGDEVSVRILDLTGGRLLASINSDKRRMAASLIKPFIMLATYEQIHGGKLKRTRRIERLIRRMIVVSNNWATNKLLQILGKGSSAKGIHRVNLVIRKYRFFHTKVVETIPPGGKTYRNYTTARDLSRFFYLLYHKRLVSPYYSELMMKKLLDVRTSRVRTYVVRRDGSPVADKTGFVCGLNGDAGIVFQSKAIRGGKDYIFVFMVENKNKPHTRRWRHYKTRVIRRLSNKVYLAFRTYVLSQPKMQVVSL